MELYIVCVTLGIIMLAAFWGLGVATGRTMKKDEGISKKCNNCKHDSNNILHNRNADVHSDTVGDFHEPVDCGQNLELDGEAEEAVIRLNTLRIGLTNSEREAIDYAINCINVKVRLEQFIKEKGL